MRNFTTGSHDSVSLFNQSATGHKQMTPPLRAGYYFYRLNTLPGMLASNKWSLSKTNRQGHPAGSFRLALMQPLRHAHTFVFAGRNSDWYTLLSHTQTYSTLPRDLWLEPAALTQRCINHWALSSTAGPQCHAELDSTGIKVCNWIQKLIQAKRQLLALKVLIPPCDDTLSLSWDLWLPH